MKKVILVLASLMAISFVFGFQAGDALVGGTASMQVSKANSNDDPFVAMVFKPQVGYFLNSFLCGDGYISLEAQAEDNESIALVAVGVGGRIFISGVYAGAGIQTQAISYSWEDSEYNDNNDISVSSNYLYFRTGLLAPLAKNVYLDLSADYLAGIGKYGQDGSGDNKSTKFGLYAGIQCVIRP